MIYKYCGFTICSEHFFPFFYYYNSDKVDLFIKIKNNDFKYSKSKLSFFLDKEKYVLNFGERGYYTITKNQIICYFDDLDYVNATICNIPMSIVSILNNKIPCHCSSIMLKNNNSVVLLMAEKGTGKSTTAFFANKYLDYRIFGDDMVTIECLNGKNYAYQGSSRIKICKDLANFFDAENIKEEVYQGLNKCYYMPKNMGLSENGVQLNNIFILERGKKMKIEQISPYFIRSFLVRNIVGIDIIQELLIKKINVILNNLTEVSMFKLVVPDTIEKLSENIKTIIDKIEKGLQ